MTRNVSTHERKRKGAGEKLTDEDALVLLYQYISMSSPSSIKLLASLLQEADRANVLDRFLQDLLTPGEIEDLVLRWRIFEELLESKPQRDIAKSLGISITKVSRGSVVLRDQKNSIRTFRPRK
jgi:TrpR family trp operon transcriptional repressor